MAVRVLFITGLSVLLTGCVVQPTPVTQDEITSRVDYDLARLARIEAPVDGPISLPEAMARALSYNLDLSLERYKTALVDTELSLSRYDQLPELVADHLSDGRSNFSGGSSQSLLTGVESLEPSTSSDRYTKTDDFGMSWDILDFGVSYYRARQAADRVLLAEEQRRKVVSRILSDVQRAYWRAVSFERNVERVEALMQKVQLRLKDSRRIEEQGLEAPLSALSYQRDLINTSRELYQLYEGLSQAKVELAFLMNVPMNADFELVSHDRAGNGFKNVQDLPMDLEGMERYALHNRSELKEITYQERITATEIKASYLGLLPGIQLAYGRNYDSNSFLFNTNWTDYSARVSWNLLDLFRYGGTRRLGEVQSDILEAQRLALSAAVLTQLYVGLAHFEHAKVEYQITTDLYETQNKILSQVERAVRAQSDSEQALIKEEMNALLASVRYDIAYAKLRDARSDLYAALGMNPSMEELDATSLPSLTRSLEAYFAQRNPPVR